MVDVVALVLRWVHVLSAIVLVGGSVFMYWVLRPIVAAWEQSQREQFHEQLRKRWALVVHGGIVLLLVSGLMNIMRINPQLSSQIKATYHSLLGIKVLVALGVFFLASSLVGRGEAFAAIRRRRHMWLAVAVALAVVVVLCSGYLRTLRDQASAANPTGGQTFVPDSAAPRLLEPLGTVNHQGETPAS